MATFDFQERAGVPKFVVELDAIDSAIIVQALVEFARVTRERLLRVEAHGDTGNVYLAAILLADEKQAAAISARVLAGEREARRLKDAIDEKQMVLSVVKPKGGKRHVA